MSHPTQEMIDACIKESRRTSFIIKEADINMAKYESVGTYLVSREPDADGMWCALMPYGDYYMKAEATRREYFKEIQALGRNYVTTPPSPEELKEWDKEWDQQLETAWGNEPKA